MVAGEIEFSWSLIDRLRKDSNLKCKRKNKSNWRRKLTAESANLL